MSEELFLSIPSIYILGLFLSILLLGAQSLRLARKCQKRLSIERKRPNIEAKETY